jgi:hypothetical protein
MIQPNELYHAVRQGWNPHAFLMYMHRKNTGGLLLEDIRYEERKKKREQAEYTRKINIHNQKTTLIPVAKPDIIEKSLPFFWKDENGRMCLKVSDIYARTSDLVYEAVELFRQHTQAYPVDIVLSPFRVPESRLNHYYHKSGIRIPYKYETTHHVDYDIMCRGLGGGVSWVL